MLQRQRLHKSVDRRRSIGLFDSNGVLLVAGGEGERERSNTYRQQKMLRMLAPCIPQYNPEIRRAFAASAIERSV
jgi:hypothetical protein